MPKLPGEAVEQRLSRLDGWKREGDAIVKRFTFASFPDAIAFANRLAIEAENADHHPDILISDNRVTVTWSTHSEGGLTEQDFEGAVTADRIA